MRNSHWCVMLMVFWLGLCGLARGQSMDEKLADAAAVPAAPPSGVLDRAGVFHRNEAALQKISSQLQQLRDEHDFRIYLVLDSVLVTGNPQSLARQLQNAWVPDGNGLVMVFEIDSKSLGLGVGFDSDPGKGKVGGYVPSYENTAIWTRATSELDRRQAPEVFLDALVTNLTLGYNNYFQREQEPVPAGRSVRLLLIIVGGVSALALVGLIAAWLLNRSDRGGRKCFFFPETEAVERLGAPYGGGNVSSRRFGKGARE